MLVGSVGLEDTGRRASGQALWRRGRTQRRRRGEMNSARPSVGGCWEGVPWSQAEAAVQAQRSKNGGG